MSSAAVRAQRGVEEVLELLAAKGHGRYGEDVTQLEHALQAASYATDHGWSEALIAACLLHDVGHLLVDAGDAPGADLAADDDHHEAVGAVVLARCFGPTVAGPVAMHVMAKRWRCATDRRYHGTLSAASQSTLIAQGGPLGTAARVRFEASAGFADAVAVRDADDAAKVPGLVVPGLESYRALLHGLVPR